MGRILRYVQARLNAWTSTVAQRLRGLDSEQVRSAVSHLCITLRNWWERFRAVTHGWPIVRLAIVLLAAVVLIISGMRMGGPGERVSLVLPYIAVWLTVALGVFRVGGIPMIATALALVLAAGIALASGHSSFAEKAGEAAFYSLAAGLVLLFLDSLVSRQDSANADFTLRRERWDD